MKWEVGGTTGEDEPKLAGAFFLGPPLPLAGHLYALAEMKGQEIRLVALSSKTGALEWSQQLAVVEQPGVLGDPFRRNAGASPSFADGVLVCPTSAGAIVAIDLTTRSLLWGYQYPRAQQFPIDRFSVNRPMYPGTERRANEHWSDGSVTISDGRVIITPVETEQIYCLSLVDGKELWKEGRNSALYVGCIHNHNVILIGRNLVAALKLADGESAWDAIELPPGSLPSGRGFQSGDYYYLPLTTAEVAKINLREGRIEARARSRSGQIPGNLICYRGNVLSQGVDYVDAYFQIDSLKLQIANALKANPDDPRALASLGEVKLDQGALGEAVELFRRSYGLRPDEATRGQLVDSLLEALSADFAANRGSLEELDKLIDQPRDRLTFWRLKAVGLQAAGELGEAFETYLKLVDADEPLALDALDERLSVRRDRWLRVRLEALGEAADADQRRQIDAAVEERLARALKAASAEDLREFLSVFGAHPAAAQAREALLARLGRDDLLERNLLLRARERSSDPAVAGAAAAEMATLLAEADHADLAAIYYRQLAGRFADVPCRDGKTGAQLAAELPNDGPIASWLAGSQPWPSGKVTAHEETVRSRARSPAARRRSVDVEISGPTGPLFKDVSLSFDNQLCLVAQDGLGTRRFRIPLTEQGARKSVANANVYNNQAPNYVGANGGLLVVARGDQLMAVDTLRPGDSSANRILWTHDLNDQIGGFATNHSIISRAVPLAWGGNRVVSEDSLSRRLASLGPLDDDGIFFQRLHDLHCVDPLSGKTLWTRKNVGLGNDLFGDEELLFVAPPADGETLVLRAATGELLGTRQVVPFNRRVATLGRSLLSWEQKERECVLEMRDMWADAPVWSRTLALGSKVAVTSDDFVGALEPGGHFVLLSLADGKPIVDEKLEPETGLSAIYLLRSRDSHLLVTSAAARNQPNMTVHPAPGGANIPMVSGHIYAFEAASGKPQWPAPAVIAQHLLLSQPVDLPVLVFVRQVHRAAANVRDPRTSVLCIDKRTGRVVYEKDQSPGASLSNFDIEGDASEHVVTLSMGARVITLSFEDQAPGEAKAAEDGQPGDASPQESKPEADKNDAKPGDGGKTDPNNQ